MMGCNQCGKCCTAIGINTSFDDLKNTDGEDAEFIKQHWHPMSRNLAYFLNPYLNDTFGDDERYHFYSCDLFDAGTNKCMCHEEKPNVCSGFPFYGGEDVSMARTYSPECGYIVE